MLKDKRASGGPQRGTRGKSENRAAGERVWEPEKEEAFETDPAVAACAGGCGGGTVQTEQSGRREWNNTDTDQVSKYWYCGRLIVIFSDLELWILLIEMLGKQTMHEYHGAVS